MTAIPGSLASLPGQLTYFSGYATPFIYNSSCLFRPDNDYFLSILVVGRKQLTSSFVLDEVYLCLSKFFHLGPQCHLISSGARIFSSTKAQLFHFNSCQRESEKGKDGTERSLTFCTSMIGRQLIRKIGQGSNGNSQYDLPSYNFQA